LLRHFEEEIDRLRISLLEMCALVEANIHRSVVALVQSDAQEARQVLENEARINQMQIEIDEKAAGLLALEQPVARDLRFIIAAMKINSDLERMGDLAKNIAERANGLMHEPFAKARVDIPRLADQVQSMVHKALDSFVARNENLAREVLESDSAVDEMRDSVYLELVNDLPRDAEHANQYVSLIFIAQNLERIADHAVNIAEDVLYLAKGIDVRHQPQSSR